MVVKKLHTKTQLVKKQKDIFKNFQTNLLKDRKQKQKDNLKIFKEQQKKDLEDHKIYIKENVLTSEAKKNKLSEFKQKQSILLKEFKNIQTIELNKFKDKQKKEKDVLKSFIKIHKFETENNVNSELKFLEKNKNNDKNNDKNNGKNNGKNNDKNNDKSVENIEENIVKSSSKVNAINNEAQSTKIPSKSSTIKSKSSTKQSKSKSSTKQSKSSTKQFKSKSSTKQSKSKLSTKQSKSKSSNKSITKSPEIEPMPLEERIEYIKEHIDEIGILDPQGKHINPLNGLPYSEHYRDLAENNWSKLPLYSGDHPKNIIQLIKDNQVLLFTAGTGVGKSVLIPKYALHSTLYQGKIVATIPKIAPVKSNGKWTAETLDVELGKEAGYQFRGSNEGLPDGQVSHSKDTKIRFSTDGSIVATLLGDDPTLTSYDIVIVDEAHERSINIDLLLMLMKKALKGNPKLKLIIMSATINKEIFKNYFAKDFKFAEYEVCGVNFPVQHIYLDNPIKPLNSDMIIQKGVNLYIDKIFNKAIEDIRNQKANGIDRKEISLEYDTLFFVNSPSEAGISCNLLNQMSDIDEIPICLEYAGTTSDQLMKDMVESNAYKNAKEWKYLFKIVFATNVAESSITIETLKYVIDNGMAIVNSYNPITNSRILEQKRISKDSAKQRAGRVGRRSPGTCYKLYTQKEHNDMMEHKILDIQQNDITQNLLQLLYVEQIRTVPKLLELLSNFIEPPKQDYINSALNILKRYNCISGEKSKEVITPLGDLCTKIRKTDFYLIKGMLLSNLLNCSNEMSLMVSGIMESGNQITNIFKKDFDKTSAQQFSDKRKKLKLIHDKSDHLTVYRVLEAFKKIRDSSDVETTKKWCSDINANYNKLNKMIKKSKPISQEIRDIVGHKYTLENLIAHFDGDNYQMIFDESTIEEPDKKKIDENKNEKLFGNKIQNNKLYLSTILKHNINIEQFKSIKIEEKLLLCLAFSYSTNISKLSDKKKGKYTTIIPFKNVEAPLSPDSMYKDSSKKKPLKYIIYSELGNIFGQFKYNFVSAISDSLYSKIK